MSSISFAKGREREWDRADSEIQIVAKLLLSYELAEVLMRRGDQPNIDLTIANVSQPSEPFLFQNFQQLGLNLKIDVTNFVEEDRAAMGHLEQSLLGSGRTRKRALLVTEEFGFKQLASQTGAVEIHKSFVTPWTIVVQPACKHAFAGSGLTENQNRTFGR